MRFLPEQLLSPLRPEADYVLMLYAVVAVRCCCSETPRQLRRHDLRRLSSLPRMIAGSLRALDGIESI